MLERDVASGKQVARLEHITSVSSAAYSPDNTRILTASDATRRSLRTGRLAFVIESAKAVFSPDGTRILTASADTAGGIWDARSNTLLAQLVAEDSAISSTALRPEGRRIVLASSTARLWGAADGAQLAKLEGHKSGVWSATFSPDGTRIVTASDDNTARVWAAGSGAQIAELDGHTSAVASAVFSPDGTRIVTASSDSTARVWDAESGAQLAKLEGHTGMLSSAIFSPDGTRIVTCSDTLRIWDSVPRAVRYADRRRLETARPVAQQKLSDALAQGESWISAATRLREAVDMTDDVRRSALELLTASANRSLLRSNTRLRELSERKWIARMLGDEAWPIEDLVEDDLRQIVDDPSDLRTINEIVQRSLDPEHPIYGDEVHACALARRCIVNATQKSIPGKESVPVSEVATYRRTLAQALFRNGRFDDALAEAHLALAAAREDQKDEYAGSLQRLERDIATWRDESGRVRHAEWRSKVEELDRDIAAIERDPDVRLWIKEGR